MTRLKRNIIEWFFSIVVICVVYTCVYSFWQDVYVKRFEDRISAVEDVMIKWCKEHSSNVYAYKDKSNKVYIVTIHHCPKCGEKAEEVIPLQLMLEMCEHMMKDLRKKINENN